MKQDCEIFTTMKIHVIVFWMKTHCGDVVGCQHFGRSCSLHLQIGYLKWWYPTTLLHGFTAQIITQNCGLSTIHLDCIMTVQCLVSLHHWWTGCVLAQWIRH